MRRVNAYFSRQDSQQQLQRELQLQLQQLQQLANIHPRKLLSDFSEVAWKLVKSYDADFVPNRSSFRPGRLAVEDTERLLNKVVNMSSFARLRRALGFAAWSMILLDPNAVLLQDPWLHPFLGVVISKITAPASSLSVRRRLFLATRPIDSDIYPTTLPLFRHWGLIVADPGEGAIQGELHEIDKQIGSIVQANHWQFPCRDRGNWLIYKPAIGYTLLSDTDIHEHGW
jgi:hypothetical protein